MERAASVQPGLPREDPCQSYWQDPPDPISDLRSTSDLPPWADIVVIGAGISGACIAHNLLKAQSNLKVVLLEARQAAGGASGRNGGHTKHASYRSFAENIVEVGMDEARKIAQFEYDCMVAVHEFIEANHIDADSRRLDTVDVYYDQKQWKTACENVQTMRNYFGDASPVAKYTIYNSEEAASQLATPNSFGALRYEAGSLSAYKLTIGILKLALSKGLNLQTNTPVTLIEKPKSGTHGNSENHNTGTKWRVHTKRGTIETSKLILATNGYTAHLLPELQGTIIPFRGIVTAQRPGQNMPQTGLETTYSFVYEDGYDYMISRPAGTMHEGDIIIGGGLSKGQGNDSAAKGAREYGNTDDTLASGIDPDIQQYLTDTLPTFFGAENYGLDHSEGRVRQTWSGIMGYSADGHPFVGPVPDQPGLYLDVSFQGHGMVLCFLCADALVQMVLAQHDDDNNNTDNNLDPWFPRCFRVTRERMQKSFAQKAEQDPVFKAVEREVED